MGSAIQGEYSEYSSNESLSFETNEYLYEETQLDIELDLFNKKEALLFLEYNQFEVKFRNRDKNDQREIEELIRLAELRINILSLEAQFSDKSPIRFESFSSKY